MTWIRGSWRWFALGVLLLLALYGITRLTNLTLLPIFTDEAIYIRWSQIGSRDSAWRYISLTDGKQPMFTWIMMGLLKVIADPLFAGRFVSVLAGFGTLVGILLLSYELFRSKRGAFFAGFLYVISPFSLMYDRLALYDSLVATFSVWSLYLGILLVRRVRLDVALLFGMVLGTGMLNKTSGFLSLYMLPATLILFDWRRSNRVRQLLKWMGLVIIATILSQFLYSILRLSPLFNTVTQKDAIFIYPFTQWLEHPLRFFVGNIRGLFDWLTHYLTMPMLLVTLVSCMLFRRKFIEKLLLVGWWLAPFVALALFGRILYPRFILFMTMPLLILTSDAIDWLMNIRNKVVVIGVLLLIFAQSAITDYFIIVRPAEAPIPKSDSGQLINDWPAGGGVKEVNAILAREATRGKICVFTEGTFGLFPYAIEIDLVDNPNVTIHGLWPIPKDYPPEVAACAGRYTTYYVANQWEVPPSWPATLIADYPKGNNQTAKLRLYRVNPPTSTKL